MLATITMAPHCKVQRVVVVVNAIFNLSTRLRRDLNFFIFHVIRLSSPVILTEIKTRKKPSDCSRANIGFLCIFHLIMLRQSAQLNLFILRCYFNLQFKDFHSFFQLHIQHSHASFTESDGLEIKKRKTEMFT